MMAAKLKTTSTPGVFKRGGRYASATLHATNPEDARFALGF
jgi:hypothetical protein